MVLLGRMMIGEILHVQSLKQFVELNRNFLEDKVLDVSFLLFSFSCQDRIPETSAGHQLLGDLYSIFERKF